jgi:hypothetical protein
MLCNCSGELADAPELNPNKTTMACVYVDT